MLDTGSQGLGACFSPIDGGNSNAPRRESTQQGACLGGRGLIGARLPRARTRPCRPRRSRSIQRDSALDRIFEVHDLHRPGTGLRRASAAGRKRRHDLSGSVHHAAPRWPACDAPFDPKSGRAVLGTVRSSNRLRAAKRPPTLPINEVERAATRPGTRVTAFEMALRLQPTQSSRRRRIRCRKADSGRV